MRTALGSSPVITFTRKWSPQRGTTATRKSRSGRPRAPSTPARIAPSRCPGRPAGSPVDGSPSTTGSVVVDIMGLQRGVVRVGGRRPIGHRVAGPTDAPARRLGAADAGGGRPVRDGTVRVLDVCRV